MVHTCALGMQELYVRRLGAAVYFSARIEPLLHVDESMLHPDEQAWASIICLGYPLGEATPFAEVRRMGAATAWRAAAGKLERRAFAPRYLDAEAEGRLGPSDMSALLRDKMPRAPRLGSVHSTLSGGWDSRLLAGLLARSGRRTRAWTTSADDGRDDDLELAGPVARALRMRHKSVVPADQAWLQDVREVGQRVQYQASMHTWLMPLARRLHRARGPLVDGLAGDVLLKSLFVTPEVVDSRTPAALRARLWESLSRGRVSLPGMFAPETAARLEGLSRESFDEVSGHLDGHPAAATLSVLLSRTMRGVAISPMLLFAPECDVHLPFVDPQVLTAALQVPAHSKMGGGYYRELLDVAVGSEVGQLPSTNDPRPKRPFGYRRQASAQAVSWMAATIDNDDAVRRMIGPKMRAALETPAGNERLRSQSGLLAMLQAVTMFAVWRSVYASRLTHEVPLLSTTP
ncbi:asparagine synthase-related protein [Couchioplanes caeruleus]|nr:asparagine synthase-related protein [Couchioplanes caeruleus]ROP28563.1 asparagine synthase [Couchioplanes caeruleus]